MPKDPNIDQATIDPHKISANLLDPTHPRGGAKARFLMRFGFSAAGLDTLRAAIHSHGRANDVDTTYVTAFGTVYEVAGSLTSPDGRNPRVKVYG